VAEQDLKNRIRGLYVTLVPDPVWPGLSGEDEGQKTETPTDPNSPEKAGQTESQTSKLNRSVGREPMKLMVRGTRSAINEAKQYLAQVDVPYKQVALQMQVVEIRKSDALQLGLDWTLLTTGPLSFFNLNQGGGAPGDAGTISGEDTRGIYTNQLQAKIDELDGALKVLSVPNTFVRDGGQSEIFVGDTIRYIESIQSTQNGVQVQTKDLDVGISLQVRPRVGADGNIAMQLFVNSSLLNRFDSVPGGGQLPQTSERRQTTEFGMKSGEMIALGGLIQDIDRNTVSGIPILKDLPLIGKLFSRTTTSRDQTSLVFFISATEVTDVNRETAADPRMRPADPTGRTKVKIGG
jgi:general secretion pathway protein D